MPPHRKPTVFRKAVDLSCSQSTATYTPFPLISELTASGEGFPTVLISTPPSLQQLGRLPQHLAPPPLPSTIHQSRISRSMHPLTGNAPLQSLAPTPAASRRRSSSSSVWVRPTSHRSPISLPGFSPCHLPFLQCFHPSLLPLPPLPRPTSRASHAGSLISG